MVKIKKYSYRLIFFILLCSEMNSFSMPSFKNKDHIKKHAPTNCPPSDSKAQTIEAYRFVNNPLSENDFLSYAALGFLPKQTDSRHGKCKLCGLSMFTSKDSAEQKYNSLPNRKNLGRYLSKGFYHN